MLWSIYEMIMNWPSLIFVYVILTDSLWNISLIPSLAKLPMAKNPKNIHRIQMHVQIQNKFGGNSASGVLVIVCELQVSWRRSVWDIAFTMQYDCWWPWPKWKRSFKVKYERGQGGSFSIFIVLHIKKLSWKFGTFCTKCTIPLKIWAYLPH